MLDLSTRQAVLSGIVILFSLPFLIFYITSSRFLQRKRSKALGRSPPTVPFYVPGVFHAFALASTGPQTYLAQLLKEYNDDDPFFIFAGPQPLLIVRKPTHVHQVVKALKSNLHDAARIEELDKIFGVPENVLDLYAGKRPSEADKAALKHVHSGLTEKYLTGASLISNLESYVPILSTNLNDKMFQVGSWTQIEDAWSFLRQVFTRCILTSLFGSNLFKQYPTIVKNYWEFAEAAEGFIPGLPRYWVPGAAVQARERLYRGIEKWLKATHSGSEFARTAVEDPVWDELKGSKFLQERDNELANIQGIDMSARVAEMLSIIHASTNAIVPCIIWSILESSRRPTFAQRLYTEVSRYSPSRGATYNVQEIMNLPLLTSLEAETRRLRIADLLVHSETQDIVLDEAWTAPSGVPILAFTQEFALKQEAWQKAQPRILEKPLKGYWPERFLVQGKPTKAMDMGLSDVCQRVLGSAYGNAMHAATLAVVLNDFEIQICDDELFDQSLPQPRNVAFGVVKPLSEVAVRIRKRAAR